MNLVFFIVSIPALLCGPVQFHLNDPPAMIVGGEKLPLSYEARDYLDSLARNIRFAGAFAAPAVPRK